MHVRFFSRESCALLVLCKPNRAHLRSGNPPPADLGPVALKKYHRCQYSRYCLQIQQVYARAVRDPYLVIADLNVIPFVQIPGGIYHLPLCQWRAGAAYGASPKSSFPAAACFVAFPASHAACALCASESYLVLYPLRAYVVLSLCLSYTLIALSVGVSTQQ